jgi:hypothetical protein
MSSSAEAARRIPAGPLRPRPGRDDVAGFGVVGLPFTSGDVLALRRFPASSFGPGYDSVWHRTPEGEWTIYTTIAPELSCPRFYGAAIAHTFTTPVEIEWKGPFELAVRVPAADLRWDMRLASTPVTRLMNVMLALMPAALFRSDLVLSMMSAMSTALLAAGRFRLRGRVPNLQWYQAGPRRIWTIPEASATIGGRALGPLGPLAEQASLGDFALPQRGLLMLGSISNEAYIPGRHLPIPKAEAFRPGFVAG